MKPKNSGHHRQNEWYVQDTDATVASHNIGPLDKKFYPRPESIEPILDVHELMLQPSHKKVYPSDLKKKRTLGK